ncbi:MAG TPA: adenylate/guanylate cyclase domain-containing protein [Acidimicrobiia bacterium]
MVRRLQATELADEAGASLELIETLTQVGVLKPETDGSYGSGDLIRLEAANAFLDAGVTLEQLDAALSSGMFTFEYLDRFHPEPGPPSGHTFAGFANSLGVSPELVGNIYLAMGLAQPRPDVVMRQEEVDLIRGFLEAWEIGGDEETFLRAARLVGEPARQVSAGWTRLFVEKVSDPLVAEDISVEQRISAVVGSTERLTKLAPPLLLWLFNRHLRHAIDQANIDGMERELVAHGLVIPGPDQPTAIAFVDISGYTSMTEARGDELAAQAAERLRHLAALATHSHSGTVVKLLGDGVMLHFDTVDAGLAGVFELVESLEASDLPAHAGIHAGPVIEHDGDYYGRTVNLASRVAGVATAGTVLATGGVVSAVETGDYTFHPFPEVELKGVSEPVSLYKATKVG